MHKVRIHTLYNYCLGRLWDGIRGTPYISDLKNYFSYCLSLSSFYGIESVSSHAREVLEEYQQHLGASDASFWIVPRIVAMMDELPTVAQGKKEIEIRTRLKLITGYLALLASSRKGSSALASSATRIVEALKSK
jgi:hypothetical protein